MRNLTNLLLNYIFFVYSPMLTKFQGDQTLIVMLLINFLNLSFCNLK